MAEETLLTDDFLRQLINVGEVDILVGLATHNNAKTIEPIIQGIQAGILKCFPRERAVIINADGGSQDGTPALVLGASIDDLRPDDARKRSRVYALRTLHAITTQYSPTPDPGMALARSSRRPTCCAPKPVWFSRPMPPLSNQTGCSNSCGQCITTTSTWYRPSIAGKR